MIRYAFALLLTLSCGTERFDAAEPTRFEKNACTLAGEAYLFTYSESVNICGDLPTRILAVSTDGIIETYCVGAPRYEGCAAFIDTTCRYFIESLVDLHEVGRLDWAEDGSGAQGTVDVTFVDVRSGFPQCTSTYEVKGLQL